MAEQVLSIRLKAIDEMKGALRKKEQEVSNLNKEMRRLIRESERAGKMSVRLKRRMVGLGKSVKATAGRMNSAVGKVMNMRNAMAGLAVVGGAHILKGAIDDAAAFEGKLASLGPNVKETEQRLKKLQKESGGMFSLEALTAAEAKLKAMAVPLKLTPNLLKALTASSARMGISTEHAMDSLSTGLARNSKMILDNLGITYNATEVYENFAKSIGKTKDELTEEEKKLAVVQEAQRQLNTANAEVPEATAASMRMNAKLADVMLKLKRSLLKLVPAFEVVISIMDKMVDIATVAIQKIMAIAEVAISAIKKVKGFAVGVKDVGADIVSGLGDGLSIVTGKVEELGDGFLRVTGIGAGLDFLGLTGGGLDELVAEFEQHARDLARVEQMYVNIGKAGTKSAKETAAAWSDANDEMARIVNDLFDIEGTIKQTTKLVADLMEGTGIFQKKKKSTFKQATKAEIEQAEKLAAKRIELASIIDKHQRTLKQFEIEQDRLSFNLQREKNKAKQVELRAELEILAIKKKQAVADQFASQMAVMGAGAMGAGLVGGTKAGRPAELPQEKQAKKMRGLRIAQLQAETDIKKQTIGFEIQAAQLSFDLANEKDKVKRSQLKTELELLEITKQQALADQERQDDAAKYFGLATAIESASGAMGQFSSNMASAMEMSGGLTSLIGQVTAGTMDQTAAVDAGIGVIGSGIASFVDGEREKAAVLAVMEAARGFATVATPWVSAGHFAAAAMFGAVAGGVIGGGGKSGSEQGKTTDPLAKKTDTGGSQKQKQAQIVVNYNNGIVMGGKQSIGRAISEATRSVSKTGQMASAF